ncbi:MAG: translocation/assembly module TamB, partial [Spirochaetaceae bacterium]|nr:translocation/assembly module TamB [Spirochaetaceae bacterium]
AARNFFDTILITSEIFVSTDLKDLLYNVPHLIVAREGSENIWASLSLSGNKSSAELSEGRIVWNDSGFGLTAFALFEDVNDMLLNAEFRARDSAYTFQANLLEKKDLNISISLGLNLSVNFSSDGAFSGLLLVDSSRFPVKGGFVEVSAEAGFRYDSPASWNINLERFKISGLKSPVPAAMTATVEIMGSAHQDGAELTRIYFDDGRGALYGSASGLWSALFADDGPPAATGNLDLRSIDGGEKLNAEARYSDGTLFIWTEAAELQSGRFFGGADNMFITGNAGFFKTRENWSAALNLTSLRGVLRGQNVTLNGTASFDNTRLDINGMAVSFGSYFASIPSLSIDLRASSLNSFASIWGNGFGGGFNTEVTVTASFAETDSWFNIKTALESFNLDVNFENTKLSTFESAESFDFKVSRNGGMWNIEGGLENMMRLHMNSGGDFFAAFSYPLPVIGTIAGFIRDGMIDAEASSLYIDVSRLWPYIPANRITISGGFAVAEVRIEGPLSDPGFFGTASVNSLRVGIPWLLADEIGPMPAFLTFAGNEVRIEPMNVRIGNGDGVVSGSLQLSRWLPSSFEASIAVTQQNPIRLNTVIAGFLVDGSVFGQLNLDGDSRMLRISGEIGSDDTEISLAPSEDRAQSAGQMTIQTDINITAGKKVEFLWPNTSIPILEAYAAAGSSIKVTSDTLSGHFSITGDVDIRSGEVFYFQRSFYIKEGQMNFNESEIQLDPRFSAVAETRDQTNREPVTISMIIENQPLSSFIPRFESTPALSQIEILTLLGGKFSGMPDEDNAIQRAFISSTADVLAQFGVVRRVERAVRDFLHIDMFSLRTQILQNTILLNVFRNTDSAENDEIVQTQNDTRIGNYFDNTTVFFGKYIGAGLFVQAMLSMRYDPLRENMGGLWVEPDLSMEFKGPLFDIRWELTPAHPENIWINDNRITLSKKWTLP